jgi:streptogramin lyase
MNLRVLLLITILTIAGAMLTVAEAQQVIEYPILSGAKAGNVCAEPNHPDGTLGAEWFVSDTSIGKLDTQTLQITEYPQLRMTSGLVGCAFSPTGLLYFANQKTFNLYAFDPKTLSLTAIPVPVPNAGMAGMTWHSDGLLYIMVTGSNVIRRLRTDNTWAGTITLPAGSFPHGPSSCADGNVWFSMYSANRLAYVTPTGVTGLGPDGKPGFLLPQPNSAPFTAACVDWDNRTYYTLMAANKIAAIDRTTFQIQQWDVIGTTPKGIAIANDRNVYVAFSATNQIGFMPLNGGTVIPLLIPTASTSPNKLGVGPDGQVWGGEHDRPNFFSVDSSGTGQLPISITLAPSTATLQIQQTQRFVAQLINSTRGVTWAVDAAIGTVDSTGLFTATTAGSGLLTATSVEDTSKTAAAAITVAVLPPPPSISVTVSPTIVSLQMHQQFSAQLTNSTQGVTWTASPAIGYIDTTGLFTATGVGTGTITATSVEDTSKSASTTVRVR